MFVRVIKEGLSSSLSRLRTVSFRFRKAFFFPRNSLSSYFGDAPSSFPSLKRELVPFLSQDSLPSRVVLVKATTAVSLDGFTSRYLLYDFSDPEPISLL